MDSWRVAGLRWRKKKNEKKAKKKQDKALRKAKVLGVFVAGTTVV